MPANNPQAYLGLLLLVVPAIVYYFVVNKDIKKSFLYLVTFFGSLFAVKLVVTLFNINIPTTIFGLVTLMSVISILIAVSLALYLIGDKFELKSVAWLAGVVIIASMLMAEQLKSVTMGFI